jgi:hypothetical protein
MSPLSRGVYRTRLLCLSLLVSSVPLLKRRGPFAGNALLKI